MTNEVSQIGQGKKSSYPVVDIAEEADPQFFGGGH
jgi:hypothetical protein